MVALENDPSSALRSPEERSTILDLKTPLHRGSRGQDDARSVTRLEQVIAGSSNARQKPSGGGYGGETSWQKERQDE
jgi:hypothetical protein